MGVFHDNSNYYDNNHIIVELSESNINHLLDKYKIELKIKKDE